MTDTPQRSRPAVTIYTDGGADPNPGPGGWGVVLIEPGGGMRELRGGEPRATNNRMELTAAIQALEALPEPSQVEMHTDSQYLRRGITEWLPGWIARGWRRQTGELQNEDLWRRLAAAEARHQVSWKWVKGHAGDRHNERADRLAAEAIREQRAAAAAGGAAGTADAPEPPQFEAFLRVSMTPRGGGWAALVRPAGAGGGDGAPAAGTDETVLSGGLPAGARVTPNALDLAAGAAALEAVPVGASVAVHTGSDYLRYGASRWLPAWRRRGWKTQEGGPVLNRELWERLAVAMAARRVSWPEVKGREIEELDRLAAVAKAAAQGALASGPGGGAPSAGG